jgi:hypothetical protein
MYITEPRNSSGLTTSLLDTHNPAVRKQANAHHGVACAGAKLDFQALAARTALPAPPA